VEFIKCIYPPPPNKDQKEDFLREFVIFVLGVMLPILLVETSIL
jgi:hypothetical protein